MAFFARPNLDNTQFKQLKGSELTLSGQTQIATTSGFTLTDGAGGNIIVTASGASVNNQVLTYDAGEGVIKLKDTTASGGSTVYTYTGLTTCAVGGLPVDQDLYNDPLVDIIHCMVSPTLAPVLTPPTLSSFIITPTTLLYEIGCSVGIVGDTTFNPGSIDPQYPPTACAWRSCGVDYYQYLNKGVCSTTIPATPQIITDNHSFGTVCITPGNNQLSSQVYYLDGVQPYDSNGGTSGLTALVSGNTAASTKNICGIYPWFWDISTTIPISATCVANGNNELSLASGTLSVCFDSSASDYLWVAVPDGTAAKTCWFVNGTNNGAISGIPGQTWAQACDVTGVTSTSGCWSGQTYNVYVTCLPTGTDPGVPMCFY